MKNWSAEYLCMLFESNIELTDAWLEEHCKSLGLSVGYVELRGDRKRLPSVTVLEADFDGC
jgi:hypothetical protein